MEKILTLKLAATFSWAGGACPANTPEIVKAVKPSFYSTYPYIIQFVQKAVVDIEPKRIRQSLQDFFKRAPRRLAQPATSGDDKTDD
jgi:hypothetical protein